MSKNGIFEILSSEKGEDRQVSVAVYDSHRDRIGEHVVPFWSALVRDVANSPFEVDESASDIKQAKNRARAFSFADYKPDSYWENGEPNPRNTQGVRGTDFLLFDFDDLSPSATESIKAWLTENNVAYVLWTTISSTPESPRFKLVLLASRKLRPDEHASCWRYVKAQLELEFGVEIDKSGSDICRLAYAPTLIPEQAGNPHYVKMANDGVPVDAEVVLKDAGHDRLVMATAMHKPAKRVLLGERIDDSDEVVGFYGRLLNDDSDIARGAIANQTRDIFERVASSIEGERNERLFQSACDLYRFGMPYGEAIGLLDEASNQMDSPISYGELRTTVRSAYKLGSHDGQERGYGDGSVQLAVDVEDSSEEGLGETDRIFVYSYDTETSIGQKLARSFYRHHWRLVDRLVSPDMQEVPVYDFIKELSDLGQSRAITKVVIKKGKDGQDIEKHLPYIPPSPAKIQNIYEMILVWLPTYEPTAFYVGLEDGAAIHVEREGIRFLPADQVPSSVCPGIVWEHSLEEMKALVGQIQSGDDDIAPCYLELQHSLIGDGDPGAKRFDLEFHGAAAYCAAAGQIFRQICSYVGEKPAQGKTTYSELMNEITLGKYHREKTSYVCLLRIGDAKTAQEIARRMMNVSGDMPAGKALDGQAIKPYATGDIIQARGAYCKELPPFRNRAALKTISNHPQPIKGDDKATKSRIQYISCDGPGYKEKLTIEELRELLIPEFAAVRALLTVRLWEATARREYTQTEATDRLYKRGQAAGDMVKYFLDECCEVLEELSPRSNKVAFVAAKAEIFGELFEFYREWEERNGDGSKLSKSKFGIRLGQLGHETKALGKKRELYAPLRIKTEAWNKYAYTKRLLDDDEDISA